MRTSAQPRRESIDYGRPPSGCFPEGDDKRLSNQVSDLFVHVERQII